MSTQNFELRHEISGICQKPNQTNIITFINLGWMERKTRRCATMMEIELLPHYNEQRCCFSIYLSLVFASA